MNEPLTFSCTADGERLSDTQRLHMLLLEETHDELTPVQRAPAPPVDAVDRLADLLDTGTTAQVLRLTPSQWREMGPHQRRALHDWTAKRLQALEEKFNFMSRSIAIGELEVPAYLRKRGAA